MVGCLFCSSAAISLCWRVVHHVEILQVVQLVNHAQRVFSTESSLLKLHAPIKVFGDIHGQFVDLQRSACQCTQSWAALTI